MTPEGGIWCGSAISALFSTLQRNFSTSYSEMCTCLLSRPCRFAICLSARFSLRRIAEPGSRLPYCIARQLDHDRLPRVANSTQAGRSKLIGRHTHSLIYELVTHDGCEVHATLAGDTQAAAIRQHDGFPKITLRAALTRQPLAEDAIQQIRKILIAGVLSLVVEQGAQGSNWDRYTHELAHAEISLDQNTLEGEIRKKFKFQQFSALCNTVSALPAEGLART